MAVIQRTSLTVAFGVVLSAGPACGRVASGSSDGDDTEATDDGIGDGDGEGDGEGDGDGDDGPEIPDLDGGWDPDPGDCGDFGECALIDVLFVVDNSGTMAEEQRILSASLPFLVDTLQQLYDSDGELLEPDVNIMFTTTDVGHPECMSPEGDAPALGAPQDQACVDRLDDFGAFSEACTSGCPDAIVPIDPFIHFRGPGATTTNVPGNEIAAAARCLAPQGITGCGYEAPLESMLLAIDPEAQWNQGPKPFMREDALLAIVFVTDEEDCSVRGPDGYAYFVDPMQDTYWEVNPDTGTKTHATSAVCWNAGVDCGAPDANGIYADCHAVDNGVLHPVERYLSYLEDELIIGGDKDVVMLGILGVPEVLSLNPEPPFQPTAGGFGDLVYRQWVDGMWPDGDIVEPGETAASKEFEFGVGPGCTGVDEQGNVTGQAIPPVRIAEVCQGLDDDQTVRCCIHSVCDGDYSDAFSSLYGMMQDLIPTSLLPRG